MNSSASYAKCFLWQGLVPAGIRLIPHTVLTFIFLEQLKKHFGIRTVSWTRSGACRERKSGARLVTLFHRGFEISWRERR